MWECFAKFPGNKFCLIGINNVEFSIWQHDYRRLDTVKVNIRISTWWPGSSWLTSVGCVDGAVRTTGRRQEEINSVVVSRSRWWGQKKGNSLLLCATDSVRLARAAWASGLQPGPCLINAPRRLWQRISATAVIQKMTSDGEWSTWLGFIECLEFAGCCRHCLHVALLYYPLNSINVRTG